MIENILFPVDLSPCCAATAPYVKAAATMFGSRITLLHVCDTASHNGFELYLRSPQEIAEEHWNVARQRINSFLGDDFPASTCPRVLRYGDPAEQIVDAALSGRFDLIIMPTHAGPFRRLMLGSTTARVLNDVDCPVLTTEHAETVTPRPLTHKQWLCAIELHDDSKRVLQLAGRAATAAGANLHLIHVIDDSGDVVQHSHDERAAMAHIRELQESAGCHAMAEVMRGPVKDALLDAARQFDADVLIVGRRRARSTGRIRDLTYSLVRDSPYPVLSV